jgi:hypothetical protein
VILLARLETHYLSRLDEPLALQDPLDGAFRYVDILSIDNHQGKLPGREFW